MPFVGGIGPLEIIVLLVIVLVIFGPKRLPGLGRSLGTGMREFKESVSGKDKPEEHPELDEGRPDAPPAEARAAAATDPQRDPVTGPAPVREPAATAGEGKPAGDGRPAGDRSA